MSEYQRRRFRAYRKDKFIERLNTLMKEKGFNQGTLAKASYTSRKTINEYVTGKKEPRKEYQTDGIINSIAKALEVDVEYLLGMTDYPTYESWYVDRCIENVDEMAFDMEVNRRLKKLVPNFDVSWCEAFETKYTHDEIKELKEQLQKQIKMTLISFLDEHRKDDNHGK